MAEEAAKREQHVPVARVQGPSPLAAMRQMMDRWADELFGEWPMMRVRPFEWRMEEFMPSRRRDRRG